MLRAVLILLLLANALFFGWARGWFGSAWPPPGDSQREPHRLAAQVRPEQLLLLGPESARAAPQGAPASTPAAPADPAASAAAPAAEAGGSAAVAAATAAALASANAEPTTCLETGPLTAEQLAALNQTLGQLGVDTTTLAAAPLTAPAWMVFAGRFADAAARRTRLQAWQRQGVPLPSLLDAPRELAPGLVFSRHVARASADAALQALASRHPAVANVARVVQAPPGATNLSQLRAARASPALARQLGAAALPPQQRFARCAAV
jgi:hypothetical protein